MSGMVDSSGTLDFEESMAKRPMYVDQHHSEFTFHRFSLLREKNILTDAVLQSSDDKRYKAKHFKAFGNFSAETAYEASVGYFFYFHYT